MKRSVFFLVLLIGAVLVCLFIRNTANTANTVSDDTTRRTQERQRTQKSVEPETSETRSATRVIAGMTENGELITGQADKAPEADQPVVEDSFVKKVIAEKWTDKDVNKAGRRRVRIVEADFKYPHIRLEEEVWTDPKTGKQTVNRLLASVADHVMVGLKPEADEKKAQEILEQNGYRIRAVESGSYILAELPDFQAIDDQKRSIAEIEALEEFIDYAEPDYLVYPCVVPNDPAFSGRKMWGLDNPGTVAGTTADADIDAPEAWAIRTDASNVIVAVTDTGIQYNHEDLAPNMWRKAGTGEHGLDAYGNDNDPMDTGGHGTHCAGTIGARGNNNIGLAGVAWNVQLMAGRFLGPNGGTTSDGIKVINYARNNDADIISASWGGGGFSKGLYNAIKAAGDAGIPFVAAAGNSSSNNDSTPHYPSSYDLPTLVAVASTTSQDKLSYFSCYGRYSVDIAAPGSDIWSCYIGSNSSYKHLNGTSMATPHVSGALALARAHFPSDDAEDLIARLYSSVDHIPALSGKVAAGGRLNLQKLLGASTAGVNNDDFENALRFEGDYGYWSGSNKKATREDDEDSFSLANTGTRSVWFAWKAPYAGLVELEVTASETPFRIMAFEGDNKNNLRIAKDGNTSPKKTEAIYFYCQQDQEYRFLIDSSHPVGQSLVATLELKPANDDFADAIILSGSRFSTRGSNRNATNQPFERYNRHAGVGKGKTVWWKWTPDFDGEFVITTHGSEFDTVLAVYTGPHGNELIQVAANDDRNALDWTSQVIFNVTAGTEYRIAVDGYRGDAAGGILLNGFMSGQLMMLKQPKAQIASLSDRVVFDVVAASNVDLKYQWFLDGEPLAGQTQNTYVIDSVESRHFGSYTVEVYSGDDHLLSNVAELQEQQIAPQITWYTGDQAAPEGVTVNLAVSVRGSQTLTYQWYKDGALLPGEEGSSLALLNVVIADKGTYRVEVSNSLGSATKEMYLGVANSPWDRLEWRHPNVSGSPVTDIKAYATEVYAVSGKTLYQSSDGVNWDRSQFPYGFVGRKFELIGERRICHGYGLLDQAKVAVSVAGGVWTVYDLSGFPEGFQDGGYNLHALNGNFIAQHPYLTSSSGAAVYYSSDGISWSRSQVNDGVNVKDLSVTGRLASDGTTMLGVAYGTLRDGLITYYSTENGANWVKQNTQIIPDLDGIQSGYYIHSSVYSNGEFQLIGKNFFFSSTDGDNWTFHKMNWDDVYENNYISSEELLISHNGDVYSFLKRAYKWYSDYTNINQTSIWPGYGEKFTAAGSYGGHLIIGTDFGNIRTYDSLNEIKLADDSFVSTNSQFLYDDGLFYQYDDTELWVSGDAKTWKQVPKDVDIGTSYAGKAMGLHWGSTNSNEIVTGSSLAFLNTKTAINGINGAFAWIAEDVNGNVMATARDGFYQSQVYYKATGSSDFSAVTIPENSRNTFSFLNGRWYGIGTSSTGLSDAELYTTANGIDWQGSGVSGWFTQVAEKDGAVYVVCTKRDGAPVVAKTTDGVNWTILSSNGLPESQSGSHQIWKLVEYNGSLVAMIKNKIYYSPDGIGWVQANLSETVRGMVTGDGQLVLLSENGGYLRAGDVVIDRQAPRVSIASPQHRGIHMLGSEVLVQGTVSDSEDGQVSYHCYVDGVLIDSGQGSEFAFRYRVKNSTGHTVVVEAVDSDGLKQVDVIQLETSSSRFNLLDPEVTEPYSLPSDFSCDMGGVTYLASKDRIYRSLNMLQWERVHLPSLGSDIVSMVAGNGALVIHLEDGEVYTTRDGVNWIGCLAGDTRVWSAKMRFDGNAFVVVGLIGDGSVHGAMISRDGLVWRQANQNKIYTSDYYSNGQGVVISKTGHVSFDYGKNWNTEEALFINGKAFETGIYADGKFVMLHSSEKKSAISYDGILWQLYDDPDLVTISSADMKFKYCGDRYFLIANQQGLRTGLTSVDGVVWDSISNVMLTDVVYTRGLYLGINKQPASSETSNLVYSTNGIDWLTIENAPLKLATISTGSSGFVAIDPDGCAWSSEDGKTWMKNFSQIVSNVPDVGLGKEIEQLGDRLILSTSKGLFYSDDQAKSWSKSFINGDSERVIGFNRIVSTGTSALSLSSGRELFHTTDGIYWTQITNTAGATIYDFDFNGSEFRAVGDTGEILKSDDGGLTWIDLSIDGLQYGRCISWFQGKWIIIGATGSQFFKYYYPYILDENDMLTQGGKINGFNDYKETQKLIAHGRMFVWQQKSALYRSEDGENWAKISIPGFSGGQIDLFATSQGYTCLLNTTESGPNYYMYESQADELVWSEVNSRYVAQRADNVGDNAFAFSDGAIYLDNYQDLALGIDSASTISVGVGSLLPCSISIDNLGEGDFQSDGWQIEAWLSKDRIFGHGNDIPLGQIPLTGPMPTSQNTITKSLKFELPEQVNTGENYLILKLSNLDPNIDSNISNNIAISETALVTIPEWILSIDTNGSGQVSQDFAAVRYPQGSRVSLTANAGKGAAFAGWGGDALGAENQITILMDGDKSVQANFSSRASLQVHVRGAGEVADVADLGSYPVGGTASITAIPLEGWEFSGWSGAATGNIATANITMDTNKVVTATFIKTKFKWRSEHFPNDLDNPEVSGDDADPDGDGLKNWQEYLHLSDPNDKDSKGVSELKVDGGYLYAIFTRNSGVDGGLSLACQGSRNMSNWDAPDIQERVLSTTDGIETVEARIPADGNQKGFLRLRYRR